MRKHTNSGIGSDNWLYIGLDSLSRYREEGGELVIRGTESGIVIEFPGIYEDDYRLPEGIRELLESAAQIKPEGEL